MITFCTLKTSNYEKIVYYIRMINLSLNELKLIAKSGSIKDYKNKSENDLIKNTQQTKTKNRDQKRF